MTSGIASYSMDPEFQRVLFSEPTKEWTPDELIAIGLKLPPRPFEPGARFDYSNTNTILLGKIIERRSGMTYTQALQDRIIGPLGLTGTSMPGPGGAQPDPHATGVTLQGLPDGGATTPAGCNQLESVLGGLVGRRDHLHGIGSAHLRPCARHRPGPAPGRHPDRAAQLSQRSRIRPGGSAASTAGTATPANCRDTTPPCTTTPAPIPR